MVSDGQCCKLPVFVFRGDRRSACGDIRQYGQLAYMFVCLFFVCPQNFCNGYLARGST